MAIWKGGPINNIEEVGAAGNIICTGPIKSLARILEIETARLYFDKEVYSAHGLEWTDVSGEYDEFGEEQNDIDEIQIAVEWFSKLIPVSILKLRLAFPDCDFKIICEFEKLSDWWKIMSYKSMPGIADLLRQGKLNGHEPLLGTILLGKSFPSEIHEELESNIKINQKIAVVNNMIDINKSFFISE